MANVFLFQRLDLRGFGSPDALTCQQAHEQNQGDISNPQANL
ncbi:hypothetical protein [Bradyrhizobium sp. Ash2021]|nr:hypothetical protein [Bradyrhizobium sp. Ash2021]